MFEIKLNESQFKGLEILDYINLDCFSTKTRQLLLEDN